MSVAPPLQHHQGHMKIRVSFALGPFSLAALLGALRSAPAQSPAIDPALMAEIRSIRAVDNHSHPPKVLAAGEKDDEFDALPCDPLEPSASGLTTRPENAQYLAAWKDLWGYGYRDRMPAHVQTVIAARKLSRRSVRGTGSSTWIRGSEAS